MSDPKPLVVLIEDEPQMRKFLLAALEPEGYHVVAVGTAREGMAQITGRNPDLVLLDLGLPDADGLDVTTSLREWSQVPVIVLSARARDLDKVGALDAGADDYLTKPFTVPELLARMRVALRHAAQREGGADEPEFAVGDLRVDLARRQVFVRGEVVHLTPTEYKLLIVMIRHAGRVLTHRQLLTEVWGINAIQHPHYLRVYMGQLRQKIELEPARPQYLLTELGVGYRLRGE